LMSQFEIRDTYQEKITVGVLTTSEIKQLSGQMDPSQYQLVSSYVDTQRLFLTERTPAAQLFATRLLLVERISSTRIFGSVLGLFAIDEDFFISALMANSVDLELFPVSQFRKFSPLPLDKNTRFQHLRSLNHNDNVQSLVDLVSSEQLERNVNDLSSFTTRYSLSSTVLQARDYIVNRFTAMGLEVQLHFFRNGYGENVIATLPGEPGGDVVLCGAHYDSIPSSGAAPGADDNGSGTSAVLELARIFTSSGLRFQHTVRFIAWCGEEQGLLGSAAYADELRRNGSDIIAYLNADMLGWTIPGTRPTLAMKSGSATQWLNELAIEWAQQYVPEVGNGYSTSCCSDFKSFYDRGFDAIGYFENVQSASAYPCYHRSCDLPEEVNFAQVTLHTKGFMAGVATLAEPL